MKKIEKVDGKMTMARGNKHKFIGVGIEFTGDGTVILSIGDYVDECTFQSKQGLTQIWWYPSYARECYPQLQEIKKN